MGLFLCMSTISGAVQGSLLVLFMLCFKVILWNFGETPGGRPKAYQKPQKHRQSRFSSQKLRHKRPTLSPGVE